MKFSVLIDRNIAETKLMLRKITTSSLLNLSFSLLNLSICHFLKRLLHNP